MWLSGSDMEQSRGSNTRIYVKYQRQVSSLSCNFKSRLFNNVGFSLGCDWNLQLVGKCPDEKKWKNFWNQGNKKLHTGCTRS